MTRFVLLFWLCAAHANAAPLPALGADAAAVTVSGLSSGGYMAVQFHVAHSAIVKGVAAVAGGPYYCAQGSLWTAYYNCMTPGFLTPLPRTSFLAQETLGFAKLSRIDPTSHLASAKVWLFSGREDRTVVPDVVIGLRDYYSHFKADVVLVGDKPAGHGMVTEDAGNACAATAPPYINDCDYDAAGALLSHLLGPLKPRAGKTGDAAAFDQGPFSAPGMAAEGFVYVPSVCGKERCRVHVAFHGCRQGAREFASQAGYNRWAEANRLVVLYPQAKSSWWPYNPRGCWDWWGYSGAAYATKEGAQVRAVKAMIERLSDRR